MTARTEQGREITSLSVAGLSKALVKGDWTAAEVAEAYLGRIREMNPSLCAYITQTEEAALSAAGTVDALRAKGAALPPLAGIPMGIQDNLCTQGIRTTCASRMLLDYIPPYSATAVQRMLSAHAVPLGKLNMNEFAMDSTRTPGESPGGPAVAVAMGMAAFALGSDTGGSIRLQAALRGLVGMRPTYGTVSRYGLAAFASSMDQVGPLTRTVADSALVLDALAGHDPLDATSDKRAGGGYGASLGEGVEGLSLALPAELLDNDAFAPGVRKAMEAALRAYEAMGARVCRVSMPPLSMALPAYAILSSAEAFSSFARFDGVRYGRRAEGGDTLEALYVLSRSEGFGAEVKSRILLGAWALAEGENGHAYGWAAQARAAIRAEFAKALADYDILLAPTAPTAQTATLSGNEKASNSLAFGEGNLCTAPASLAGLPSLSIPWGMEESGLPFGLQLVGRAFEERTLYRAAAALEREGC